MKKAAPPFRSSSTSFAHREPTGSDSGSRSFPTDNHRDGASRPFRVLKNPLREEISHLNPSKLHGAVHSRICGFKDGKAQIALAGVGDDSRAHDDHSVPEPS